MDIWLRWAGLEAANCEHTFYTLYCFIEEVMKRMDLNSPNTDNEDDVHVARPGLVPMAVAAGDTCH